MEEIVINDHHYVHVVVYVFYTLSTLNLMSLCCPIKFKRLLKSPVVRPWVRNYDAIDLFSREKIAVLRHKKDINVSFV